jgi:hypothetical protein
LSLGHIILPDYLLSLDGATGSLAGTRIGPGTLSAQRQATTMTNTTEAAKIHQTFDVHGHFSAEVTLNHEFSNLGAKGLDLGFIQLPDFIVRLNTG